MLINQQYTRHGPDYRFGEQVTFLDVKQTFGFSHVRVGRWVTRDESRLAADLVFDSLADLAFILKLPPLTLGLRETVSLAFGHGGQKVCRPIMRPRLGNWPWQKMPALAL
ncbi:hypothetical protein LFREDSHE_25680 [Shewanella baltica]